jgi:hypothetical protein
LLQGSRQSARGRAACLVGAAISFGVGAVVAARLNHWRGRPFFLDEGWRAFAVSNGDVWRGAAHTDTPLSLGFMLSARTWTLLFGNSESVLRSEPLVLLPVLALLTFLLTRSAAPVLVATAAGAAVVAQTTVVNYATMFKQYIGEATATAAVMLLWLVVVDPGQSRRRRLLAASAIGLLQLYSTPSVFLVMALVTAWWLPTVLARLRGRRRESESRRWMATISTITLGPGVLHAAIFLRHQTSGLASNALLGMTWDDYYPPHGGITAFPGWLVHMAQGWVPGIVTNGIPPPLDAGPPPPHTHGVWAALVAVGMLLALLGAVLAARRSLHARWILAGFVGAQVIVLCLAALHTWPTGFNRTNLFLLPLFVALLAVGAAHLFRSMIAGIRGRKAVIAASTCIALVVIAGAGVVGAVTYTGDQRAVRAHLDDAQWGQDTPAAIRDIKTWCGRRDLVIVAGQRRQFEYYYFDWEDPAGRRPTATRSNVFAGGFNDPAASEFLSQHQEASRVCLMEAYGVSGELHAKDIARIANAGFQRFVTWGEYPLTGLVTVFAR